MLPRSGHLRKVRNIGADWLIGGDSGNCEIESCLNRSMAGKNVKLFICEPAENCDALFSISSQNIQSDMAILTRRLSINHEYQV